MDIKKVKISELKYNPRNTRIHTRRNLETLKQSLSDFGQVKPILVNKNGMYVIAGNGTMEAALALGWEEIECNICDLDEEKAMALSILDNKTSDLSQNDEKMLTEILSELKGIDIGLFDLTGFKEDELDSMLSFQDGTLFQDEQKQKAKEEKRSKPAVEQPSHQVSNTTEEKSDDAIPSYSDQVTCVIFGYPFVLSNSNDILEIKHLFEFLRDADKSKKDIVEADFFKLLLELLTRHFLT